MNRTPTVLFVDDEKNILHILRRELFDAPFNILLANSAREGLTLLQDNPVDLVISDIRMPDMDGLRFLEEVKNQNPRAIRAVLSGHLDEGLVLSAITRGIAGTFFAKPWDPERFRQDCIHMLSARQILRDPQLLALIHALGSLPSLPGIYIDFLKALDEGQSARHLPKADLVIFFTRLLSLPEDQLAHIVAHLDSGKPSIILRTGNHGFLGPLPYKIDGKPVRFEDIIGGTFLSHHGNWQQDSTRGDIVPEMKNHPVLTGVKDIWGPSDVYRTFKEGTGLPDGCTALVYGQPLIGRERGGADNPNKEPLPVVWTKEWKTSKGASARILHSTMGSARDLQCPGLRRLVINGVYWGIGIEDRITPDRSVDHVGIYEPLSAGFNYEKLGVVPRKPAEYVR